MGAGMAANLLKAGHQVTVYNRSPQKEHLDWSAIARLSAWEAGTARVTN